jgi:hypothetical protein
MPKSHRGIASAKRSVMYMSKKKSNPNLVAPVPRPFQDNLTIGLKSQPLLMPNHLQSLLRNRVFQTPSYKATQ